MSPAPSPSAPVRTSGSGRRWLVPALIAVVALLLVAVIVVLNRDGGEQGAAAGAETGSAAAEEPADDAAEVQDAQEPDLSFTETRDAQDVQALGPVDAPVALVVFSDYQCPYCAAWSEETLPVMREYAERGDLRIEWRDVNVFGPASEQASKAAHAAGLQDGFWEYHDALFAGGEHRPEGELSGEALTELAGELGLDTERFASDMESAETAAAVEDYAAQGIDIGAFSTPAFVVGGQPIVGAQPTDVFVAAIDEALAEQG